MAGKHAPRDDVDTKTATEADLAARDLVADNSSETLQVLNNILEELREIKMHMNILTELER